MPRRRDPRTDEEWQEAVLLAHAVRMIYDCRIYGLIEGGPRIDVVRCDDLIDRGADRGICFTRKEIREKAIALVLASHEPDFGGI